MNSLGAELFTGAARSVIARWPTPPAVMLAGGVGGPEYADFQTAVLQAQMEMEQAARELWYGGQRSVVVDRGIDHLAYTLCFVPRPGPLYLSKAAEVMARFAVVMGDYRPSLAVYLPVNPDLLERARASRGPELQPFLTEACVGRVDAAIRALLMPYMIRERFCSLAGVHPDDYLQTMLRAIGRVRAAVA